MYIKDMKTIIMRSFEDKNGTIGDMLKGVLLFFFLSIVLSVFFFSVGTFIFFLGALLITNLEIAITWLPFMEAGNDAILYFKFIIFLVSVVFGFMCLGFWLWEIE